MSGMGRREFVALLGGAAASWPLADARATAGDAGDRLPKHQVSDMDAQFLVSFRQGLSERGLIEGQNAG